MADATGEAKEPPLRVAFDRRIKLEFHGARITSDGGLLAYRELDDALGLTAMAASALGEGRRGRNIRHHLLGPAAPGGLRPARRLRRRQRCRAARPRSGDARHRRPARASTGRRPRPARWAASRPSGWRARRTSRRSRTCPARWIDRVHRRRPPDGIILDMDSSESPTHGAAGGLGLERPLRLHLLPPAVRLQPVRRPGALRPAARQRPQRRRLAGGARAGDRPLP